MRLVHESLENPIFTDDIRCSILVLENPRQFYQIVRELAAQLENDQGSFVLSHEMKPQKLSRYIHFITDFPFLDFNPRKVLTGLYKQLSEAVVENDRIDRIQSLLDELAVEMRKIAPESETELDEIETPGWNEVFKFFNLQFRTEHLTAEEALSDYFRIMRKYCGYQIFVILNSLGFLNIESLRLLIRDAEYENIQLLFLEDHVQEEHQKVSHQTLIVDREFCEILINHL